MRHDIKQSNQNPCNTLKERGKIMLPEPGYKIEIRAFEPAKISEKPWSSLETLRNS